MTQKQIRNAAQEMKFQGMDPEVLLVLDLGYTEEDVKAIKEEMERRG